LEQFVQGTNISAANWFMQQVKIPHFGEVN
jgi:hypothetical protein